METLKNLSAEKAIELLNAGNHLTRKGENLDTIYKKKNGTFSWKGKNDRDETILETEQEIKSLFSAGKEWALNLFF